MNGKKKLYLSVLYIVTAIVVIIGLSRNLGFKFWNISLGGYSKEKLVSDDISFDNSTDIQSLDVKMSMGDLDIVEGDVWKISYTSFDKKPTLTNKDGKLSIVVEDKAKHLFGISNHDSKKMVITVPKGTNLNVVKLNMDMGDVDIKSVKAYKFDMEIDMGDVDLERCSVDVISASLDMGDFDAKKCTVKSGKVSVDMGDLDMSGDIGDVTTDVSMGDKDIKRTEVDD